MLLSLLLLLLFASAVASLVAASFRHALSRIDSKVACRGGINRECNAYSKGGARQVLLTRSLAAACSRR